MTKVVHSREYSTNFIAVGCSVNEDGEPLVEMNGAVVGTVDSLLEFIGKYRNGQKPDINIDGADKDTVARLRRDLDDLKSSLPKRIEQTIDSARIRNVRRTW